MIKKGDIIKDIIVLDIYYKKFSNKYLRKCALVKCKCGKEKEYLTQNLTRKYFSGSCGCKTTKSMTTHKMTNTHFYKKWDGMKYRCNSPTSDCYNNYGGRGISMCDRWEKFENFYDDMYESYILHLEEYGKLNTTIDRIDNNGNYCKENCRWATVKTQIRNTRANTLITAFGKTQTLIEWQEETGISRATIQSRIKKYNWKIEDALTVSTKK